MASSDVRVAIVTGANKGIGYYIAKKLLQDDFEVVLACRDMDKAAKAADQLASEVGAKAKVKTVRFDLEDVDSITTAAAELQKMYPKGVDAIIHNAGFAFKIDATEPIGVQAEKTMKINFFNTVTASEQMLPLVKTTGRVVFMGSRAGYLSTIPDDEVRREFIRPDATVASLRQHAQRFVDLAKEGRHKEAGWPGNTYGTSKVALAAYARRLAMDERVRASGVTVNWCCPGWCKTDMAGDEAPKSAEDGADTPAWLASSPEVALVTGKFYGERKQLDWENGTWD